MSPYDDRLRLNRQKEFDVSLNYRHLALSGSLFPLMLGASCGNKKTTSAPPPPAMVAVAPAAAAAKCDDSLWDHVYTGDPKKFKTPQERLKVITACMSVTGTIFNSASEKDGDVHIRL